MISDISKAVEAYDGGRLDECLILVDRVITVESNNVDALMLKAQVFYKQQFWGKALNLFNMILDIDPENGKAQNYKTMVMNILTYWNKDRYNP